MNAMQTFSELNLHSGKDNERWYARHPSQPNLLFFKGASQREYYAVAMKDRQIRKIMPVTLGLDILASKDWEIVKVVTDRKNNVVEIMVLDVDS